MRIINHDLPVYYNPEYNGLHVVHSKDDKTAIVGSCCHFYNDAYTNICRYEIPVEMLKDWILIDKENLLKHSFITEKHKYIDHPGVVGESVEDDLIRCQWYLNRQIKKSWYVKKLRY